MHRILRWLFVGLVIPVFIVGVAIVLSILFAGFYLSPQSHLMKADAIVAISGGETDQRVDESVRLFKQKLAPKLIFSGAAREGVVSNALAMKRRAETEGVGSNAIEIEELSTNTDENAKNVGKLVQKEDIRSIILVTSPYHQRRAYITFHRVLGKDVAIINHSSVDSIWRKSTWWQHEETRQLTLTELGKIIYIYTSGTTSV